MKNKFGQLLKENSKSLYDIARETGIAYSVLYYFKNNERDIQVSTAFKISKAFNCTIDDLFTDKGGKNG